MVFCGQCGLQLAPGTKACPRCGAAVESDIPAGDFHTDDPTVASPAYQVRNPSQPGLPPAGPSTPPNPKLVLRPDNQGYDYNTQAAYDPTSRMDASNVANRTPGYGTASGGNYPPAYADYRQSGGAYPPMGASYPGFAQQGGTGYQQPSSGQYPPAQSSSSRGRSVGLVLILIGLLFVLAAVILFALQNNHVVGSSNDTPTPTTATTPTVTQQAQALIQEYYNDVNAQNYQAAYNLWKNSQQTFQDFENGYKNTLHDQITFGDSVVQPDGTVKVTVTVVATQKTSSSTQQTTYQGYYLAQKQSDNSWKIIGGNLVQV